MELTEEEIFETYGTLCKHCSRKNHLPYELKLLAFQVDIT